MEASIAGANSGIDWGSVPDWLAAIGTVGAVTLSLFLLLKQRRAGQAFSISGFVVWISDRHTRQYDPGKGQLAWTVNAHNTTGITIPCAWLVYTSRSYTSTWPMTFQGRWSFPPGVLDDTGYVSSRVDITSGKGALEVVIRDAVGGVWSKNLTSGRVRRRNAGWLIKRKITG